MTISAMSVHNFIITLISGRSLTTFFALQDEDAPVQNMTIRPRSPLGPPSIFSREIWLDDNCGDSLAFARDVKISGWTNVGDKLGGAYVGVEPQLLFAGYICLLAG